MSVILIDTEGLCFCNCASKCVIGKCGSASRCTKEQLEELGFTTLQVASKRSQMAVHKAMTRDGKSHKLKIRDISK